MNSMNMLFPIIINFLSREFSSVIEFHKRREIVEDTETYLKLNIRRESLLRDAIRFLKLSQKSLSLPLRITFIGEPGHDDGGLRREFASLLVQAVAGSSYFCNRSFTRDEVSLQHKIFFYLGQLLSITVLQGGFGLPLFSPATVDYILYNDVRCNRPEDDVDPDLKDILKKVSFLS